MSSFDISKRAEFERSVVRLLGSCRESWPDALEVSKDAPNPRGILTAALPLGA